MAQIAKTPWLKVRRSYGRLGHWSFCGDAFRRVFPVVKGEKYVKLVAFTHPAKDRVEVTQHSHYPEASKYATVDGELVIFYTYVANKIHPLLVKHGTLYVECWSK